MRIRVAELGSRLDGCADKGQCCRDEPTDRHAAQLACRAQAAESVGGAAADAGVLQHLGRYWARHGCKLVHEVRQEEPARLNKLPQENAAGEAGHRHGEQPPEPAGAEGSLQLRGDGQSRMQLGGRAAVLEERQEIVLRNDPRHPVADRVVEVKEGHDGMVADEHDDVPRWPAKRERLRPMELGLEALEPLPVGRNWPNVIGRVQAPQVHVSRNLQSLGSVDQKPVCARRRCRDRSPQRWVARGKLLARAYKVGSCQLPLRVAGLSVKHGNRPHVQLTEVGFDAAHMPVHRAGYSVDRPLD
jgi:hypothetical protein